MMTFLTTGMGGFSMKLPIYAFLQLLFTVNMKQNHIHKDFPPQLPMPGHKTTK